MLVASYGATHHTIAIGGGAQFRVGIGPLLAGTQRVPPPEPNRRSRCLDRTGARDLSCARYLDTTWPRSCWRLLDIVVTDGVGHNNGIPRLRPIRSPRVAGGSAAMRSLQTFPLVKPGRWIDLSDRDIAWRLDHLVSLIRWS